MPECTHHMTINAPIAKVWDYVNNLKNWATLMPGYQGFTEEDSNNAVWKLKGDVGPLQKTMTFKSVVTTRQEPSKVEFTLKGIGDPIDGAGAFIATANGNVTNVELRLSMKAGGLLGAVVNAILSGKLPKDVESLASGIKSKVEASA